MSLRKAKLADARAIAEVHVASWQGAYRGMLPDALLDNLSADRREAFWQTILAEDHHNVLVYVQSGVVVGFANVGPSRDEGVDQEKTGEIYAIYFTPQSWGSGSGTVLADAVLKTMCRMGFVDATLWVLRENQRAIRFYEKMGFEADGAEKVETWQNGMVLDEIRYCRSLEDL